jgi:hypothetical protein
VSEARNITAKMLLLPWGMAFAAVVSAEYVTTTIWDAIGGFDRVGYYGSVVGASDGVMTVALKYDNETNAVMGAGDRDKGTWTIGPRQYEYTTRARVFGDGNTEGYGVSFRCERTDTASDAHATCTNIMDPGLASAWYCDRSATTLTGVLPFEYGSGTWGGPGVTTVTQIYTQSENVPWCSEPSASLSSFTSKYEVSSDKSGNIATYQLVITAGQEKLAATAGATPGTNAAKPTGTGTPTGTGDVAGASTGTSAGLAAPMKTGVPALAGVGALAAAFFL